MTQERETGATAGEADSTGDAVESSGGQTVEEVEAFWRNRTSGIQRAHNAETAALHEQMEALKKPPVSSAPAEGESADAARMRALEAELQQEKTARQAIELQARYPLTAGVFGDEITRFSPEKLAASEAFYEAGAQQTGFPPIVDPNAAPRRPAGVPGQSLKPLNEKTKDELLADLRKAEGQIRQEAMDRS